MYVIGGSMALKLQGIVLGRPVGDLDIHVYSKQKAKELFELIKQYTETDSFPNKERSGSDFEICGNVSSSVDSKSIGKFDIGTIQRYELPFILYDGKYRFFDKKLIYYYKLKYGIGVDGLSSSSYKHLKDMDRCLLKSVKDSDIRIL